MEISGFCSIVFTVFFTNITGNSDWPSGVFLKYTSGDQLGPVNLVSVKPLVSGEYYDLSVNMISPSKAGMYQGQWRMCTPTGQFFGGELNLRILPTFTVRFRKRGTCNFVQKFCFRARTYLYV